MHNITIDEEPENEINNVKVDEGDDTNDSGKNDNSIVILNQDVTRGGVKVDTGRDSKTGYVISRLSLINAQVTDIGNYTCRLSSWPQTKPNTKGLYDTISVHVLQGENTEAIQQEANGVSQIKALDMLPTKLKKISGISPSLCIMLFLLFCPHYFGVNEIQG